MPQAIVVVENFAWVVEQVIAATTVKHVVVTGLGDMLGLPERPGGQQRRQVREAAGAAMAPAGRSPIQSRVAARGERAVRTRRCRPGRSRFPAIYWRNNRGAQGRDAQHGNIVANMQQAPHGLGPSSRKGRETVVTALPLYHIFALTMNWLTLPEDGRDQRADHQSARHPGFGEGDGATAIHHHRRREHPVQRPPPKPRFRANSISLRCKLSAAGGMAVQKAVAEKWKRVTGKAVIEATG